MLRVAIPQHTAKVALKKGLDINDQIRVAILRVKKNKFLLINENWFPLTRQIFESLEETLETKGKAFQWERVGYNEPHYRLRRIR